MIFRLLYISRAAYPIGHQSDLDILETAVANNARHGITGMLLRLDRRFVQVIEGAEATVQPLFENINKDPRHHSVRFIGKWQAETRMFGDWSMAYRSFDRPLPRFDADKPSADKDQATALLHGLHKMATSSQGVFAL